MTGLSFAHVALNCRDLSSTERFYTELLGFERGRVIDLGATRIVFLRLGDVRLELFQAEPSTDRPDETADGPPGVGVRHLAFQTDDVDAVLKRLEGHAALNLGPLDFNGFISGWRSAWLTDPDGRVIEISQGYRDEASTLSSTQETTV
jgi:glyoxylase I family protein